MVCEHKILDKIKGSYITKGKCRDCEQFVYFNKKLRPEYKERNKKVVSSEPASLKGE